MGAYLFWKLPGAWFMGAQIYSCDAEKCVVRLPYRWRSQNPFRSIYFAAQCAAAELSTGMLSLVALEGQPPVSMLVVGFEAQFLKKAGDTLLFTCEDGAAMLASIQQAIATGEAQTFTAISVGRLPDGSEASRMVVTWSFKVKRK